MPIISAIAGAVSSVATAVGSAFTAVTGFVSGLGTIGKSLLSLGLSVGVSAIQSALARTPQQKPGSVTANLQIGGNIPRQVVFGRMGVKGQLAYAHTYGASNSILQMVIILSDGWCGPITRIRVNEVTKSVAAGDLIPLLPVHNEITRWGITGFGIGNAFGSASEPSLQVQYYDGRPGQLANGHLVEYSNGRLTSSDRFAGMAYIIVTASQGTGNFDQIPEITVEFEGYRCYDPRLDSTAGGSGSHRLADVGTWEPSSNPAVQIYNYLVGIRSEDQTFMGMDVPVHETMTPLFVAAANICDESVPLDTGGVEPRYRSAHLVSADDGDHRSAVAPLLQAMAGYMVERSGLFGVVAGAAQLPVATITDADVIWGRGVTWQGSKSRTERVNEVHGQFLDSEAGWQANSYPAIQSAAGLAYDGERLAVSLDFAAILSVTQAQRVARARLRETRREATATLPVGFHLCWLDPGDWVTWNSAIFATTRTYRVMSREVAPDDTVTLTLQEVGNEIYSWSTADELPYQPPAAQGEGPLLSTVQNFAVQADVVADRSVVRCTWTPITDTRIDGVIIEYRPVGTTNATRVRDDSPYDGLYVLDQPPTGVQYEFRATITTTPPRPVMWTSWVTIPVIDTLRDGTVGVDKLTQELRDDLQAIADAGPSALADASQLISEEVSELEDRVERMAEAQATEAGQAFLTRDLVKVADDLGFAARERETQLRTAADEQAASERVDLASRLTNAETGLTGQAAATTALTARVTNTEQGLVSQSQQTSALSSRLSNAEGQNLAVANAVTQLNTQVSQQGASITSLSNQTVALQASVTGLNGQVAGQANAINTLGTTVTQQGNAITAQGQSIQTVQAQIAGQGSVSLTQLQSAFATNQGTQEATWGVVVAFDGQAAGGIRLQGLRRPGHPSVVQFGIRGDVLVDGSITAQQVAFNTLRRGNVVVGEITQPFAGRRTGAALLGAPTTTFAFPFTSQDACRVSVDYSGVISYTTVGEPQITGELRLNGVVLGQANVIGRNVFWNFSNVIELGAGLNVLTMTWARSGTALATIDQETAKVLLSYR